jgi:hypothetical protein
MAESMYVIVPEAIASGFHSPPAETPRKAKGFVGSGSALPPRTAVDYAFRSAAGLPQRTTAASYIAI